MASPTWKFQMSSKIMISFFLVQDGTRQQEEVYLTTQWRTIYRKIRDARGRLSRTADYTF